MSTTKFWNCFYNPWRAGTGAAAMLLMPALSTFAWAQPPGSTPGVALRAEAVQRAIPAGLETMLEIQTKPNAVCTLRSEDGGDQQQWLRLEADDDGIVRVHAKPKSVSKMPVSVLLECTAENGQKTIYPVELRAQQRQPGLRTPSSRLAAKGVEHPAIEGDVSALTNQELVARGYPPRPDAATAPRAYAKWLSIVSRPFTSVSPRRVARPDVRFSPTIPLPPPSAPHGLTKDSPTLPLPPPLKFLNNLSFSNWSGGYMTNPDVKYWDVQADWVIPTAQDVPLNLGYAAAAEWVGLDSAGNDLVQSGSDSEAYHYSFFGEDWTFTNYSVWIESLPNAPYFLPNFPAAPGDQVSISIFLADQNGNTTFSDGDLTPSDDTVWFMIYNLTTGNSYWGTLPKPAAFSGSTVDFIIEAPNVNGSTTNLADFGLAGMHDCFFADSWFGFSSLDYNGSDPLVGTLNDISMFNGATGDTLASAYIYANFGTPGGGNIFWVWQNYN